MRRWLDAHSEVLRLRNQIADLMQDYWVMAAAKDAVIAALKDELDESERLTALLRADAVLLADRVRMLVQVCPSDLSDLGGE